MGLQEIITKIQSDGAEKVKAIHEETASQVKSIHKEADGNKASLQKEYDRKRDNAVQELRNRRLSEARVTQKKELLDAQSMLIDRTFEMAKKKILELPEKKYIDFLLHLINSADIAGDYSVLFSEADLKKFGELFVNKAAAENKKVKLTLGKETRNLQGGFVLKGKETELSFSLDVLLTQIRRDMEPELARILFS